MKLTFLGTGTSVGIPVIGCDCAVCRSRDPRDTRTRTSIYLQAAGQHLVVDTTPDFRQQALRRRIPRVDAVLFTHAHADHVFGFDDIRRYNTLQDAVIPAYAAPPTLADLRRIFRYIGTDRIPGLYRPLIDFRAIDGPFSVGDVRVTPVDVDHPPDPTLGFRFDAAGRSLGYVPDCLSLPEPALAALAGVEVMVLDALKHTPHRTHMCLEASIQTLRRIGAARSFIIHMCHDLGHQATQEKLPPGIEVAYDGLDIDC